MRRYRWRIDLSILGMRAEWMAIPSLMRWVPWRIGQNCQISGCGGRNRWAHDAVQEIRMTVGVAVCGCVSLSRRQQSEERYQRRAALLPHMAMEYEAYALSAEMDVEQASCSERTTADWCLPAGWGLWFVCNSEAKKQRSSAKFDCAIPFFARPGTGGRMARTLWWEPCCRVNECRFRHP